VREGKVEIYPAGFRDYAASLAHAGAQAREARRAGQGDAQVNGVASAGRAGAEEPAGKKAFEEQRNQARAGERKKKRIVELESMISDGENKLAVMRGLLCEDPGGDWAKLAKMAQEEQSLAKKVETLMAEWTKLSEEADP
jgi:ATP-binding cassette subfamily F protein 3